MATIDLKMNPPEALEKDIALAAMDEDIERFSAYMETLPAPVGCALSRPERALLKTYLVAKLRGKF